MSALNYFSGSPTTLTVQSGIINDMLNSFNGILHEVFLSNVTNEHFSLFYSNLADQLLENTDVFLDALAVVVSQKIHAGVYDPTPVAHAVYTMFRNTAVETALGLSVGDDHLVPIVHRHCFNVIHSAVDAIIAVIFTCFGKNAVSKVDITQHNTSDDLLNVTVYDS